MSWHCSQELAAEYWAASSLDGAPSALSKSTPTPAAYYWPDKTTGHSRLSRFGMTSEPLTERLGEAVLTWFREGFPARTSARQDDAPVSRASDPAFGWKWPESSAKYDPVSRSWKTRQSLLLGGLASFSETWPRWGLMRDGELSAQQTLVPPTCENESGLLPTPTATDHKSESMSLALVAASKKGVRLTEFLHRKTIPTMNAGNAHWGGRLDELGGSGNPFRGTEIGKLPLNPCWTEEVMGWPIDWTDLKPLETARFQEWLQQHGDY